MKYEKKNFIILLIVFVLIFILNSMTPYLLDDYSYSLKFDSNERIHTILDIIAFQKMHYMNWGGRVLAHSIAQIFLLIPKYFFNFFNSLMFVLEGFLIYKIVFNYKERYFDIVLIYLMLWFLNPVFGQINLWLVGSCNYLWTMCIILFYIYLFENYENTILYKVLLLIFGLLSGMCNENTSLALIFMLLYYYFFIDNRKNKYKIISLIFCIFGYLFLFFAPGNFVRAAGSLFNLSLIIYNFKNLYILLIIPFVIFSVFTFYFAVKKNNKKIVGYYIAIVICVFSLIGVPQIFFRNFYSAIIFIIIILLNIIKCFDLKWLKMITIFLVVVFIFQYMISISEFRDFQNFYKKRESILKYASHNGIEEVYLDSYYSNNSKIPISLDISSDLSCSTDDFPNNVYVRYFKVNRIIRNCD